MSDAVTFAGVTKVYGQLRALDGVTLAVGRGEMFGLIGPDGAGKTTAIRLACGLLRPDAGTVSVLGRSPTADHRAITAAVGYLSQRFSLYGDLTIDENVAFFAEIHGVTGWRSRRDELLEMLRMTPFRRRLAARLSGGMKQKLALACTLIHTPQLLVLDEPTTGVDPVSRRDFWRILARLQRDGLTLLLTTPYLDEAERCQRVALMDHGRILNVDTPDNVRATWGGAIVEMLASPRREALLEVQKAPEVADAQAFGERLHLTLKPEAAGRAAAVAEVLRERLRAAGLTVESSRAIPPGLEDIFIARIGEERDAASSEVNA
jgi:ABC-2 type transport system ATP-binding protein